MNARAPSDTHVLRQAYWRWLASPHPVRAESPVAGKEVRRRLRAGEQMQAQSADHWDALDQAWVDDPGSVWIWSDLHLFHEKILLYSARPFRSLAQMHDSMQVAARRVPKDNWVLFLGDVALSRDPGLVREWMEECPGKKMLVLGNHDVRGRATPQELDGWRELGFSGVADCHALPSSQAGPRLWLTHYPMSDEKIPGTALNVHGHTHQAVLGGRKRSACVELLDYAPQPLLSIL